VVVQLDNITELERDMADIYLYFPSLGSSENGKCFPGGRFFIELCGKYNTQTIRIKGLWFLLYKTVKYTIYHILKKWSQDAQVPVIKKNAMFHQIEFRDDSNYRTPKTL